MSALSIMEQRRDKPHFLQKILAVLSFSILLGSFFYVFASVSLFDSDFWWHISTGRYIVQTGSIPDHDPFSYTENLVENKNLLPERSGFILKQYWLGQAVFYLIYDYAGPKGIIIVRALILLMVILLALWQLKRWNVSFYVSFICILLLYLDIMRYTGERPVLFTILFTPLTFIILEARKEKKAQVLLLLLPLMLLWSNLHGGFIIGIIIITVYMVCEGLKLFFKKASYSKSEITTFYIITTIALLVSYINPTGWDAFSIAFSSKYKLFETGIQEYQSPFYLYINKLSSIDYGFVIFSVIFIIILIVRNRRMDLTHIVLLSGFFLMAAKTGRFTIYYISIAAMVLGKEMDIIFQDLFKRIPDRIYNKLMLSFGTLALISSLGFFLGVCQFKWLKLDIARGSFVPEEAVNFIETNRIPGNMFNEAGYGGYITWRLYPWKKTFIDTRWLNFTLQSEYAWMMNAVESIHSQGINVDKKPLWKRLLDNYNTNFILFDTLDVYGNVPNLLLKLNKDKEWVPIYCEPIAVIFIKNAPENLDIINKFKRTKDDVYNTIISIASSRALYNKDNPKYLITLGKTFYEMGRYHDALTAYQYAYRRFPKEQGLQEKIAQVESELKKEKK